MCGIAGVYGYHPDAAPVDRDELVRIRESMRSRGPDGHGEWLSGDGRVGLGHRRLSVIDLSERGHQPMRRGANVIVFNGEIYNYRELRRHLVERGYELESDSDTEVLLHLYAERGEAMFEALRGMYAFALWDGREERLLLARDPYGIKPLYVADDGRHLRVASQVRALLAGGRVGGRPDLAGVAGFYLFGSVPEPHTIFSSIRSLAAGSLQTWSSSGPGPMRRHFHVPDVWAAASRPAPRLGPRERAREIASAVRDTVTAHLVADVPVGAFLSAGLDSSMLVGTMSDLETAPVSTITMGFAEFRGTPRDEAPLAEEVARQYETRHTTSLVDRGVFERALPRILDAMDQPTVDGINTWLVSRATREAGLKVAISGLGGDELFGGYPSTFRWIPRMVGALRYPARIPRAAQAWRDLWRREALRRRVNPKLAGLIAFGGTYPGAYLLRRGLFLPWELADLMGPEAAEEGLARLAPLRHIEATMPPAPAGAFARVAAMEACLYMRNQLLRDSDWASMAHSLELRIPLVDATLLRRLAPLLTDRRAPPDKRVLGAVPKVPLPRAVVDKPKTGFGVPLESWIRATEQPSLTSWRRVPLLADDRCPWPRRLAYALIDRAFT